MITDQGLPAAVTETVAFARLTEMQVVAFEGRLIYINEIADSIEDWLAGRDPEGLGAFLDRLEMDLAVNQNVPGEDAVSSYLVHTAWTYDSSPQAMQQALAPETLAALDRPPPALNAPEEAIRDWLGAASNGLRLALEGFYRAASFTAALGHYIALDILLAGMLCGVYKARLNPVVGPEI